MSIMPIGIVDEFLAREAQRGGSHAEILEAGCGRYKHFNYQPGMRITGLDISREQLAVNTYVHEKIEGDVQTYHTDRQWDVVVSIFVLEHLDRPEAALENMLAWTKPGGLLIIAVPNVFSLKGLVTKLTPLWFHNWFYRNVYRWTHSAFPTTLKLCISPASLHRFFQDHVIAHEQYSRESFRHPVGFLYDAACLLLKVLTLGRYHPENSNYLLLVRRAG